MIDRESVLRQFPLEQHLDALGIKLRGGGTEKTTNVCPAREHKKDHLCVSVNLSKQTWKCHACDHGGSVVDWIAIATGETASEVFKRLAAEVNGSNGEMEAPKKAKKGGELGPCIATYDYVDEQGELLYQVRRHEPKTFRQRRPDKRGGWINDMEGVRRVLYHLLDVMFAEEVWIVEGEKDADNLKTLGFAATCNVGGATKWMDGYTEPLEGKDVVICGDNDDAGAKHVETVRASLEGKVKSLRIVKVPAPHKDVSDWISTMPEEEEARMALMLLRDSIPALVKGVDVPVFSMRELEAKYRKHAASLQSSTLNLSHWLPSLQHAVRSIVPGEVIMFVADTGVGKCLGIGTPLLMHDGTVKTVENIQPGDLLMGPDSKPRRVLSTTVGKGELFRITPRNGEPFVCNGEHVLNLKCTGYWQTGSGPSGKRVYMGGKTRNITVLDYLATKPRFKHLWKLWKAPVEFSPSSNQPIPPYILGLWLGDGHSHAAAITTGDVEVSQAIRQYAQEIGLSVREEFGSGCISFHLSGSGRGPGVNPFINALRQLGVFGDKHIPRSYLVASEQQRLELLAGLVDTDGYCPKRSIAIVTTTSSSLAHQVAFLARSLGFCCSVRLKNTSIKATGFKGVAWNISICGDVLKIPTRIRRRRPLGSVQRTQQVSSFTVDPIGVGDYYGFELDGDGLFLLGDFTVTHNTALLSNLALHSAPLTTLFCEMELPETLLFERVIAAEMRWSCVDVEERYVTAGANLMVLQDYQWETMDHIHICPAGALTVEKLEKIIVRSELKTGKKVQLVLIDYIQLMKADGTKGRYEKTSAVAEDLKTLAKKLEVILVVASQIARKDDEKDSEITLHEGKDSGSIENSAGIVIGAWRDQEKADILYLKILKNTKGRTGKLVTCNFDGEKMRITEKSPIDDADVPHHHGNGYHQPDPPLPAEPEFPAYSHTHPDP